MVNDQKPGKADKPGDQGTQEDSSPNIRDEFERKLDGMMPEWVHYWEPTPFEIALHESEQRFLHKKTRR